VVGYTGGKEPDPTYRRMRDHTEAIQITYDPERISYETLLAVFWSAHSPTSAPWSTQYRSAIWPHDAEQRAAAEASHTAEAVRRGKMVYTAIEDPGAFTPAEDYHQKYRLRHDDLLSAEVKAMFPDAAAFARSTTAARLNGYLGGHGTPGDLDELGLSPEAQVHLKQRLGLRTW